MTDYCPCTHTALSGPASLLLGALGQDYLGKEGSQPFLLGKLQDLQASLISGLSFWDKGGLLLLLAPTKGHSDEFNAKGFQTHRKPMAPLPRTLPPWRRALGQHVYTPEAPALGPREIPGLGEKKENQGRCSVGASL